MGSKKIISITSKDMVYHNWDCRFAQSILESNVIETTRREARQMGYRPCRCCNSMSHLFKGEQIQIQYFIESHHMEMAYSNGMLFVKTNMGFWKIVYIKAEQKFVLYHGNRPYQDVDVKKPSAVKYHRQKDEMTADTIMEYIIYIQKHDKYKFQVQEAGGDINAVNVSNKYARHRANQEKRQSRYRIDNIFAALERENRGLRQLSIC